MVNTNKLFIEFYCLFFLVVVSSVILVIEAYHAVSGIWGLVLICAPAFYFTGALIWLFRMGLECIRYVKQGYSNPEEIPIVQTRKTSETDMLECINDEDQRMLVKEVGYWFLDSIKLLKNAPNMENTVNLLSAPIPALVTKKFWFWMKNRFTRWAFRVCILGAIAFLSYSVFGLLPLGMAFVFCWAISGLLFIFGLLKTF